MQPFGSLREDLSFSTILVILDSHLMQILRGVFMRSSPTTFCLDQIIADKIGGDTPHRSLELTTEGLFPNQIGCSYISYDAKGNFMPARATHYSSSTVSFETP